MILSGFWQTVTKLLLYIIAVVVIIAAVVLGLRCWQTYNASSQTYGTPDVVDNWQTVTISEFDLSNVVFYSNGTTRSYQEVQNQTYDFDGSSNTYNLLVNSTPADRINTSSSRLEATHIILIEGLDQQELATMTINFVIQFYASQTTINISTVLDDNAFAYLLQYIAINGFNVQVIEGGYEKQNIEFNYSLELADITMPESVDYTGSAVEPEITVTYADRVLSKDVDYTVTFTGNDLPGIATATITGIGDYSGTVTEHFIVAGTATVLFEETQRWYLYRTTDFADFGAKLKYSFIVGTTIVTYEANIKTILVNMGVKGAIPIEQLTSETDNDGNKLFSINGTTLTYLGDKLDDTYIGIYGVEYEFPGQISHSNLPNTGKPPSNVELIDEEIVVSDLSSQRYELIIEGIEASASLIELTGSVALGDDTLTFASFLVGYNQVITLDGVNISIAFYCFTDNTLTIMVNCNDLARLDEITITISSLVARQ